MRKLSKTLSIIGITLLVGCSSTTDNTNDSTATGSSDSSAGSTSHNNKKTVAYYGDKKNNSILVVDVDNMIRIDTIATTHNISYAAETIKTLNNSHATNPKMYIDNRGSNAIDVLDTATNSITKTINLQFYPRSISTQEVTGLVAVSSSNKAMTSIIDSSTDTVIATVGENNITAPTTSGHSYVSSGTLACGHPHWLDQNHFVLLDRQNKKITTYKLTKNSDGSWATSILNTISTPSPIHNLIPPEVHGQKHNNVNSTIFFATAEGATDVYPSVLKLTFSPNIGLTITDELKIQKTGLLANVMGVHHLNFLKNKKTIYVGSHEGNLFVIDYSSSSMRIMKTIQAGVGAGHTAEDEHTNMAVVINHKDTFITLMNTQTNTKIADITVSKLSKSMITGQTQSHPQYHFSKDGRYFYLFLTQEGALVKVDLTNKTVSQRLELGGELAMGSFIER
jgi:YVTN family beta-propeller protein